MQNVEERDKDDLRTFGVGRGIAIGKRKDQAQGVGHANAHERIERVKRKSARALRNFGLRGNWPEPGVADGVDAVDGGSDKKKNGDIDQEGPRPARTSGPPDRWRDRSGAIGSD